MKELLEAGVHFGHQTKRWNPKMREYIFGERNGIYIIDLQKTLKMFKDAARFVGEMAAQGKNVLFVGTKRQAQEAIAEEAIRIIQTFVKTGVVLNCVNLATRTPARWQLVVRHYDRVGVLAFVMDQIRRAGINIEEVQNVIFEGAAAASCRIQLDAEPGSDLLAALKAGNPDILGLEVLRIGD